MSSTATLDACECDEIVEVVINGSQIAVDGEQFTLPDGFRLTYWHGNEVFPICSEFAQEGWELSRRVTPLFTLSHSMEFR